MLCSRKELRKVKECLISGGESLYEPSLWYFDLFDFLSAYQDDENFERQQQEGDDGAITSPDFDADLQYLSDEFEDDQVRPVLCPNNKLEILTSNDLQLLKRNV